MTNFKQCKDCQLVRAHIFVRSYEKAKIYADETGKLWRGHVCPACLTLRYKRGNKDMSARTCRKCKVNLDKSRYFHCVTCVTLEPDDGDWVYFQTHTDQGGLVRAKTNSERNDSDHSDTTVTPSGN